MTAKTTATAVPTANPEPADLFAGGGAMGELMRATDWAATPLGPVEQWPQSLRTMLGVVLRSRFPMLLWWGHDLLHLYNDGYRLILRDKHPASLAAPAARVWAEVWAVAGPMAQGVLDGGPATWTEDLQLFVHSGGIAEETYFTFSYSAVPGDDGHVGGVLNTVQETTQKVRGQRQIQVLRDLTARAAEAQTEDAALAAAVAVLAADELSFPFAAAYRVNAAGIGFHAVARAGLVTAAAGNFDAGLEDQCGKLHDWMARALRDGQAVVVDDVVAHFGPMPAGQWGGRSERALLVPVRRPGAAADTLLILGVSPHRPLDDSYRAYFTAAADQVAGALATARAFAAEKQRAEALVAADRAKTEFFANVSHEFRTPLTLMLGPLEQALREPECQADRATLAMVHRNAMRLLKLVNALLAFTRAEAARETASFEATDLGSWTTDLTSAFRSAIEQAGLQLDVACPALSQPAFVDRHAWERIVFNLLSNALKHTFDGRIGVALSAQDGHAVLTVRDTGIGIDANEQARLFDRFHRVHGARARSHEGSGIGLALVAELVRMHGGSVSVHSEVGVGSTFTVTIPLGSDHLPRAQLASAGDRRAVQLAAQTAAPYVQEAMRWEGVATPATAAPDAPSSHATAAADRPRVLVVDDNADLRDHVCAVLATDADLDTAHDDVAALERIRLHRPDLVLSDVMMPRLDGFGLVQALRNDPELADLPIVLLSARAGEEATVGGMETGADDYLVKPFSALELRARVRTHLQLSRQRRQWRLQLQRRGAELAEANVELAAFNHSVSHDLRAPLRAIMGYAAILQEDFSVQLGQEGQRLVGVIRQGGERLARLVDDLLAFSQCSRGLLASAQVDMTAVVREVADRLTAMEPGRVIHWSIGNLPAVVGDRAMLTQVWTNLLGNALKFSRTRPEARIAVTGTADSQLGQFSVADNGVGFDKRYADRLFAVFERLHANETFEGSGVGLAIVERVVRRHGGRVWADCTPGDGATFSFCLPLNPEVPDGRS